MQRLSETAPRILGPMVNWGDNSGNLEVTFLEVTLQIARASEQIAQATLIKMEDQREQMGRIKGNFNEAETKIDRSSSILSWLGRWFYCFNCCRAENPAPVGGWCDAFSTFLVELYQ